MSDTTVVFIQRGFPPFLKYCVEQAKACDYRVIVIGDDEVGGAVDCEFYNIVNYMRRAEAFERSYTHIGSNSFAYELFCFQRWYILRDLMDEIGGNLIVLDSDVLAYPGLEYIKNFAAGRKLFNVPWANYFKDISDLDFYLDFVDSVYRDPKVLKKISEKYIYAGTPQMSDMYLFYEIGDVFPDQVANMRDYGSYLGIDNNIRDIVGYKNNHHHKIVFFEGGIPYCERDVGGRTRFFTFHFQGISKPLMQYMHCIQSHEGISKVEDLNFWFEMPGHNSIAGWEDTLSVYNELKALRL